MTEGPQKTFLTCSECHERVLVEIPEDPEDREERTTSCPQGHAISYDERTALTPAAPGGNGNA